LFLQKKLTNKFQAILSYSYSISRAEDLRYPGTYYNWDYDFRHVFTAIGGYKSRLYKTQWYKDFKKKKWYKIFGWILPLSDEIEISFRWRFLGGKPYTLPTYHPELKRWQIDPDQKINSARLPTYHRLDLLIQQRYIFSKMNLLAYLDLQNVYDRDNIWEYTYNEDGTKDKIYQYKIMPVGGFTLEF
ncbi:MAG: hypothetical protein ACE5QV_04215, partial [Fidelibacterota bacterium]